MSSARRSKKGRTRPRVDHLTGSEQRLSREIRADRGGVNISFQRRDLAALTMLLRNLLDRSDGALGRFMESESKTQVQQFMDISGALVLLARQQGATSPLEPYVSSTATDESFLRLGRALYSGFPDGRIDTTRSTA